MKNKSIILSTLILLVIIFVSLQNSKFKGQHQQKNGSVYYFKDGFIAVSNQFETTDFYVYEYNPELLKSVNIQKDGIEVVFKNGALSLIEEDDTPLKLTMNTQKVKSYRPHPGTVAFCLHDKQGYTYTKQQASTSEIKQFIETKDWSRSINSLTKNIKR